MDRYNSELYQGYGGAGLEEAGHIEKKANVSKENANSEGRQEKHTTTTHNI